MKTDHFACQLEYFALLINFAFIIFIKFANYSMIGTEIKYIPVWMKLLLDSFVLKIVFAKLSISIVPNKKSFFLLHIFNPAFNLYFNENCFYQLIRLKSKMECSVPKTKIFIQFLIENYFYWWKTTYRILHFQTLYCPFDYWWKSCLHLGRNSALF